MKRMAFLLVFLFVVAAILPASARTVDFTLWRGETLTAILHDHAEIGPAPQGIGVRLGVAKDVRYLEEPFETHYRSFADRVVWGCTDPGVRVVSLSADRGVKPGTYACGDLRIRVLDRVLPPPEEWKYHLDLWQHPWAVARWNGVEPFSAAHYEAMRPLWKMLADAGCKVLTTTLLDQPWNHQCYDAYRSMVRHIRTADGKWRFDYRVFDEYVEFGRSCGLGPDIACYTLCPWDYVVRWEDERGETHAVKAVPGSPEFREYWGDFLSDFAAHLKEKGWFDRTYIAMDERTHEDVMDIATFVRERAPGLKISLACNQLPSEFKGIELDNCCFSIRFLTRELLAEAAERRRQGKTTTYYVCCHPDRPNTFCSSRLEESFWLGAFPAFAGLDGFLRWAWNSWPRDPIADASYTGIATGWKAGDTFLVYPDGSPSLRFLELRNGIVAAEKVRILRAKGLFPVELHDLGKAYDPKAAQGDECDFRGIRRATQDLVNREVPQGVTYPEETLPAGLRLSENGASRYVIVRPDAVPDGLMPWIDFLAGTLRRMTGAEFPVVSASARPFGRPAIAVGGPCEAKGFEDYVVRMSGRDLIVSGSDARATALAIRHFLTRICGCRFYDEWTESVPSKPTLDIPELALHRQPTFTFRCVFGGSWEIKWKKGPAVLPPLPGRFFGRPGDVHTFYYFTRDWLKDREDLLSMTPDGKRRKLTGQLGPNFCYTHPDARRLFKAKLREFIELDRRESAKAGVCPPRLYSIFQNDASGYSCHCPACDAFKAKHGGEGALLVDLANDLARDIAKDYPDIVLLTSAYAFSETPPESCAIEPNVAIEVTRTRKNYYSPVRDDASTTFREDFRKWASMAPAMGCWEYWVFYWDAFPAPYHNVNLIRDDLLWYYENGVRYMRIESEQPTTASFRSLKAWLADELLQDLTLDDEALIGDFMKGFYGPAAPEMRELMDLLGRLQKGQCAPVFLNSSAEQYKVPPRKWLDADFYAKAEDIFTRAEAKVRDAPEQIRLNVRRERIPVDLSELYVYDAVKPAIGRKDLAERYRQNQEAQYALRVDGSVMATELAKMRSEVEKLVRLDEINARKARPKPVLEVPRSPAKATVTDLPENSGINAKGVSFSAAMESGDVLVVTCTDTALTGKPKAGAHIYDGDDWEVMLAEDRNGRFAQVIVGPERAQVGVHAPGKPYERIEVKGLEMKSEIDGTIWRMTLRIPLKGLPLGAVRYGNVLRGGPGGARAWSPTFGTSFCDPSAFGEIRFK